jgi:hypothetical protein
MDEKPEDYIEKEVEGPGDQGWFYANSKGYQKLSDGTIDPIPYPGVGYDAEHD